MTILSSGIALLVLGAAHEPELFPDAERSFLGAKPDVTVVTETHVADRLVLKFQHGTNARLVGDRFEPLTPELVAVDAQLEALGATRSRIWLQDDDELVAWRRSGEERSGKPLHDLTQFYHVQLPEGVSVGAACDLLNQHDVVELAYPLGMGGDPVAPPLLGGTPDFESLQGYRQPAPLGIDAGYGNSFPGGTGAGTIIADCETGWTDDHEDLINKAQGNYVGLAPTNYPWNHGTAVLGEMVGEDNGFGVRGICYDADVRMSTHQGSSANFATAIQAGVDAVGIGDFVVIEIQCFSSAPGPHPCEYDAAIFAVVETATANGIHVFSAAGNGDNDLDSAAYGGLFDKNVRDSGAVMVGASDGSSLDKASFSNYGSRLDAQGWGFDVTSSGYGDLQGGIPTEEYTDTFSGTSSATPIVTGAGVIVNSIAKSALGGPLDPFALRDLLTQTGTPQGAGGQIGPRPDLREAIDTLLVDAPMTYCTAKTSSAGCVTQISTSDTGAQPVSGAGDYSVTASEVQRFKNGLLFAGASGPSAIPFNGGVLCVNPPNKRGPVLGSGGSVGCTGSFATVVNDGVTIPAGLDAGPGNSGWYQWWYRDLANGAGLLGTALSNAVQLDFQ